MEAFGLWGDAAGKTLVFEGAQLSYEYRRNKFLPDGAIVVSADWAIRRGDPVMVEATQAGFSISREAIAQGDAAAGQRFLAKADGDKTAFQAIAIDSGRATLPGWPGTN